MRIALRYSASGELILGRVRRSTDKIPVRFDRLTTAWEWLLNVTFDLVAWVTYFLFGRVLSWFGGWLRWCPTSMAALQNAERRLLSYLRTVYLGRYVDISQEKRIWTISLNEKSPNTPIVLVHGFASGVGLWVLNLDDLAENRPVYAFDLLGFGRSSRPKFSSDASEAELELINSIEDWRQEMNLDKFILLGHSLGGYLASSYSLRYPDRVKHLILADPWGFPQVPPQSERPNLPIWVKAIATVMRPFNPLAAVRAAGPFGPRLIEKVRPDLTHKFSSLTEEDTDVVSNYIYHCNAQYPSGETAFKVMTEKLGWAKHPMINRICDLRPDIPLSIIYGSRSWIDRRPGYVIKQERQSNVSVHVIPGAGHHVHADEPKVFNSLVYNLCNEIDSIAHVDNVIGKRQIEDNAKEDELKTAENAIRTNN